MNTTLSAPAIRVPKGYEYFASFPTCLLYSSGYQYFVMSFLTREFDTTLFVMGTAKRVTRMHGAQCAALRSGQRDPVEHHRTSWPPRPHQRKRPCNKRLSARARQQWPQPNGVGVRFRGAFAYVTGQLAEGHTLLLMRLRYAGSASAGASRSTWPARAATRTPSYPPATWRAHPKTPSTPRAASTSLIRRPDPTAWT